MGLPPSRALAIPTKHRQKGRATDRSPHLPKRGLLAWVLRFCFYFPASSAYLALKLLVVSFLNLLLFHGFSLIYFELPCPPNRGGSDLCGPANTDHRLIFANRALTCSD